MWTAKDFEEMNSGMFTARDFETGAWQKKAIAPVSTPEPAKTSFSDKLGDIGSNIGTGVKKAANWVGDAGKWLGKNIAAGAADYSNAFYNTLQSIGGDKVPGLNKLLGYGERATESVQAKGGTDIGSQVVRSLPGAAQSTALAILSGGTSLPAKLGTNATVEAVKGLAKSPAFVNSAMRSYGGTYGQARDAGASRSQAIPAALMNALPNAMIEVSGGLEQIPNRAGQGLLKTIGRSALEEAGEEVMQYPFEGLAKKATYAPNTPYFSTKEDAVINPIQMGQNALVGGLAGGLLGGAGKVSNDVFSKLQKAPANVQTNADLPVEPTNPVMYVDPYGNASENIQDIPKLQLPAGRETQQAPIAPQTDFYTDAYGNAAQQVENLPRLLLAPGENAQSNAPQANERFAPNRFTPGEMSDLNSKGINLDVTKQSETNPFWTLQPPAQPDYQAAAGERTFPYKITPAEDSLSKSAGQNPLQVLWKNQDADQPVTITGYAGRKGGRDYINVEGSQTAIPLDEIDFHQKVAPEQSVNAPDQTPGTKEFNVQRKQDLDTTMQSLLETSDQAKDKAGWALARETMERNNIDVFGQEAGQKINDAVFRPVHENEAKNTKYKNKYVDWVKGLDLKNKKHELSTPITIGEDTFNTLTDRQAVQMVGEQKIGLDDLPATMDKAKIETAVKEFRTVYNRAFGLANKVLMENGYEPVKYRKDYFPHYGDPADPFSTAMKKLGFKVDSMELPTDIAGITHYFRPGKKWFGHFLERTGDKTTFDALEGFERYLYGISDVIYHTNDIQRLRALEKNIRYKYAPDTVKQRVAEIEANKALSYDEQRAAIDEMFEINRGHLGSYVTNLREYTDSLAGKKSISDRDTEHKLGRGFYNAMTNLENQVSKNMVGWNVSSWLTNFIPIAQAGGGIKTNNLLKATYDTVVNYAKDDGFADKSTFLTNRRGTNRLTETAIEKISKAGSAPMEWIDDFTTQVLTRGKYLDEISAGKSPKEAMRKADAYTAGAVADRSKGALPTTFNTKNPVSKMFKMFQVEVNNQYSFLLKDLPREAKEQGAAWLASALMKFMVGSFLYNELYEKMTGRRPTLDPIGSVKKTIQSEKPMETAMEEVAEQAPFIGGLMGGGRLPISAALPDLPGMLNGETTWQKELQKPLYYLASPFGGGGQLKKTLEGTKAYNQGASMTDSGRMRFLIDQTPANQLRTGFFGQYSTPEAREYFDQDRAPLGGKQTEAVMQSDDPKTMFERFMFEREMNSVADQIKAVAQDQSLSQAERERKIAELRDRIFELRDTQKAQPDYGNIDLNNRPVVNNPDGSISTVYSMTFGPDENGDYVLVPGVRSGLDRVMTDDEAWQWYMKTGEYLGKFKSLEEAEEYAQRLHKQQASQYAN